jgi:hypothetical protein
VEGHTLVILLHFFAAKYNFSKITIEQVVMLCISRLPPAFNEESFLSLFFFQASLENVMNFENYNSLSTRRNSFPVFQSKLPV